MIKTATFKTVDTEYRQYDGQTVNVIKEVDHDSFDYEEVGPMYEIQFSDNRVAHAFEDELK